MSNRLSFILGSHNSWSYLPPKDWWLWPLAFTARCQSVDIKTQYALGVRCFDLRIIYRDGSLCVAHGPVVYAITPEELTEQLQWLNDKGDCYVRTIHEVRHKDQYTQAAIDSFRSFCDAVKELYPCIRFWCGRNLFNWKADYDFGPEPSCEEVYASVCSPSLVDDWWPWLFAKTHNRLALAADTKKDILLIDFVDIK